MMKRSARSVWGLVSLLCVALASVACGDDSTLLPPPGAGEAAPEGEDEPGAEQKPGAVLIASALQSPDDINVYVGAFPELPSGELDYTVMREFGNSNVYTAGGYVFVEESGTVTRFSVGDDYQLIDGPQLSWANYGFAEANQSYVVFATPTRAYAFVPPLGVVLVWNPETMEITGTLPLDLPPPPADFETYAYDGVVFGDKVVWSVISANWETYEMVPGVLLAMTDRYQDAPVTLVSDERCLGGGTTRVAEDGTLYAHAGGNLGIFVAYSEDPELRTCMLRMNPGETTLDPDFLADYRTLTGSYVSYPWVHVAGDQYLVKRWDPAVPVPTNPDEYWDNPAFTPLLVDTKSGQTAPYPDVARGKFMSGIPYILDGVSYFEISESGAVEGGTTDVVALTPGGTRQQFHMSGSLSALGRIR